jgi:hypothetical protein
MRRPLSLTVLFVWISLSSLVLAAPQAADDEIEPIAPGARVVVLVPITAVASWRDLAFLCAIPAATVWNNGDPIVLAVDAELPFRPELLDFLRRFEPSRLFWLGSDLPVFPAQEIARLEHLAANDLLEASLAMLLAWPSGTERVVFFDSDEPSSAMLASALAARLRLPLYAFERDSWNDFEQGVLAGLGVKSALFVGSQKAPKIKGWKVEGLKNGEEITRYLLRNDLPVDYIALVNLQDSAAGRNRNLALAAPLLAAAHNGVVAPIHADVIWKRRFDATEILDKKPNGAMESSDGWRKGAISILGEKDTPFVTGKTPQDGRYWLQLDRNRDGKFSGTKEPPLFTGDDFELGKVQWTADLDAEEANRGRAIWMTSPTAAEIHAELQKFHKAAKQQVQYLCLVGWPDALPMAVISYGQGIDADLVSDLPYTQTDDDPFVDLAHARFIAEDLPSATLLACRGFARDDFPQRDWEKRFATAEWEESSRAPFQAAGFSFAGHHAGEAPFDAKSPLANSGLIVHSSHAMWTVMGKTYAWDSNTLLAPALVVSAGCSTASLDQDAEHRSVASRLLKNGAVAFVGNSRRGIAEGELYFSEFWNAVFAGQTIGQAQRSAQNFVMVAMLEKGQQNGGPYFYQMHHQVLFGDPALQLGLSFGLADPPALAETNGDKVHIRAPQQWHRTEYTPLAEWQCIYPKLWAWRGAGVGVENTWHGADKRNEEQLLFHVKANTRKKYDNIEVIGKVPDGLGWTGTCYVDEHADGSRSLYWRVRLIDADKTTGEVRAQVEQLDFRLISN